MKIIYVGYNPSAPKNYAPEVVSYECDGVGQPLPPVCDWKQLFVAVGENGERFVSREEARRILENK